MLTSIYVHVVPRIPSNVWAHVVEHDLRTNGLSVSSVYRTGDAAKVVVLGMVVLVAVAGRNRAGGGAALFGRPAWSPARPSWPAVTL